MDLHLNQFETESQYNTFIEGDYLYPNVSYIEETDGVKFQKDAPQPVDPAEEYLTFVALEDGTFQLSGNSVDYSLDGGTTWTTLAANTATPTVTAGNKIMWKGNLTPQSYKGIGIFTSTGRFNAKGNPMSLLFGDNFIGQTDLTGKDYAFYSLFHQNTNLINASNLALPATTLIGYCYGRMFYGCNSLTTAPALPATTLANNCYRSMFEFSTSLTTAPTLPATTLAQSCYQYMFRNCTSLTIVPELPATTLAESCYMQMFNTCTSLNSIKMLATDVSASNALYYWVNNVSATGTFTKATGVTIPSGVSGIPEGWTVIEE